MARPLRVQFPGAWYHVYHRGLEQRVLFTEKREYSHFLELLGEVSEAFDFEVHAYCLMSNHYHLVVRTPAGNLSEGMKWLGQSYASWFNARHSRVGTLYGRRFGSTLVEQGRWVFQLGCYVHLNPVMTKEWGLGKQEKKLARRGVLPPASPDVVAKRLDHLRRYPWNSYRAYAGYAKGPPWLSQDEILRRASRGDDKASRKAYREAIRAEVKLGGVTTWMEQNRHAIALGSASFVDKAQRLVGKPAREVSGKRRIRRNVPVEDILAAIEEVRQEDRDAWLDAHGDPGKWLAMWLTHRHSGLTQQQIGDRFGKRDYAAVSDGVRRFNDRLTRDRDLRQTLQQVQRILNLET